MNNQNSANYGQSHGRKTDEQHSHMITPKPNVQSAGLASIYSDYSKGLLNMEEAAIKKNEALYFESKSRNNRMMVMPTSPHQLTHSQPQLRNLPYSSNNHQAESRSDFDHNRMTTFYELLSLENSINLQNTTIDQNNEHSRLRRHIDEVESRVWSKYNRQPVIQQNAQIYDRFKAAIKENILKKKVPDTSEETLYETLEEMKGIQLSSRRKQKPEQVVETDFKTLSVQPIKSGYFFLDQPDKTNNVFLFHISLQSKEEILQYLHDELRIMDSTLQRLYNQKRSQVKRRYESQRQILRDIIKGLLMDTLYLEKLNTSNIHSFRLSKKAEEEQQFPTNEFILMIDFVQGLDITAEKVRVKYCYFRQSFPPNLNRTSNEHLAEMNGGRAYIKELEAITFTEQKSDFYLYFQVLVFHNKEKLPESIGWSIHQLYNKDGFIVLGQFKVPFYDHRLPIDSVMVDFQKSVGPTMLCFSILRLDPEKEESPFRELSYYNDDDYILHEMHTEERVSTELQDQKKKKKNNVTKIVNGQVIKERSLFEEAFKEEPISLQTNYSMHSSRQISEQPSQKSFVWTGD